MSLLPRPSGPGRRYRQPRLIIRGPKRARWPGRGPARPDASAAAADQHEPPSADVQPTRAANASGAALAAEPAPSANASPPAAGSEAAAEAGQLVTTSRGFAAGVATADGAQTLPTPGITSLPAAAAPTQRFREGWWFALVWVAAMAILVSTDSGRMIFDTKLGVDINAAGFLARLWPLWNPLEWFGTLQNQYIGYAIPMAPFYLIFQLMHVPIWLIERLWMSVLITVGFAGLVRLAAALRIGTPGTRLLGAAMFVLWPTFTVVVGSTSADVLPGFMVPWAILPLVAAVQGTTTPGRAAARSGLAIVAMSGVNAAATLTALLLPALYVLLCSPRRRRLEFSVKWLLAVAAATAWWLIPLILQGRYSFNFLPYIEQTTTTAKTMSASAVLRGAGFWTAYFNLGSPWLTAGWALVSSPFAIVTSGLAASVGLFGLARRDMPARRWLLIGTGLSAAIMLAGYYGPVGGPLQDLVNSLLDGPAAPFRSLYKFEQVIAVALALGCAHALGLLWRRGATVSRSVRLAAGPVTAPVTAIVLAGLALPALSGQILQPGSFTSVPGYWYQTARYLDEHAPRETALLVPAAAHGQYRWGEPIDEPMEPLASSPWVERTTVPFGGAGSQVVLSTIEQAIESGQQVPGLPEYLARAGIRYLVIRNDLSPSMSGYVAPQVVNETVTLSGFERVAAFGPRVAAAPSYPSVTGLVAGEASSYPAVEIYQATDPAYRSSSPVATMPTSSTMLLNGGPDSLLQLAGQGLLGSSQPTVIAGDALASKPATWAVTDGQRRADNYFGLTDNNLSFTYTATETNPPDDALGAAGGQPGQILPVPAAGHETVAVLTGAAQVTASSYGSWLEESPQYDPVNAFDGNPDTAWTEGSPTSPDGQWIQITFSHSIDLPPSVGIQLLDNSADQAIANDLVVTTARGQASTATAATATEQQLNTPSGPTRWLRITIAGASNVVPGATGAGISGVDIPGVKVTRYLEPAEDPAGRAAGQVVYSFAQSVGSPYGQSGETVPLAMSRVFSTSRSQSLELTALAMPNPGQGLDRLVARLSTATGHKTLQISASSTWDSIPQLGPDNLIRHSSTAPWIAGADDRDPTLELRWHGSRTIGRIILTPAYGQATAPTTVDVSSRAGARLVAVGLGGVVRLSPPLRTDRLYLSFPELSPDTAGNTAAGQPAVLPVGLAEISIPALHGLSAAPISASTAFTLGCGAGPDVSLDGHEYQTSVTGTVGALTRLLPVAVRLCTPGSTVYLPAARHWLQAQASSDFTITNLSLSSAGAAQALGGVSTGQLVADTAGQVGAASSTAAMAPSPDRPVRVTSWQADSRTVEIGPGRASYLEIHENVDAGWHATLDGRALTAVTLDGWQQAFVVPAGPGGLVRLSFTPATIYHAGLAGSALALLVLVAIALGAAAPLRRWRRPPSPGSAVRLGPGRTGVSRPMRWWRGLPPPGRDIAMLLPLAVVIFLAGGPAVVAVPVLYLAGRWKPAWLPGIALIAMALAGVASAATQHPTTLGDGPFGPVAQVLALVALAAALMSIMSERRGE
jgi:arabinofuranan 3-O-arabinosyltransferase